MKEALTWLGKAALESTLTSGVLAVLFGGTVCYCAIKQIPTPDIVIWSMSAIIAFFFSQKLKNGRTTS